MKVILHILFVTLGFLSFAQATHTITVRKEKSSGAIISDDTKPSFPGGLSELNKFVSANIKFPETYKTDSLFKSCKVYVKFVVNENGDVSNPEIIRGCFKFDECDKEALRVVGIMPKWSPAIKDGKPIKHIYSLPVSFKIQ